MNNRAGRTALSTFAVLAVVALVSGCAQRDSIIVGAVPDDYRTRHPIVIGEKDQVLDLPVGLTSFNMTRMQQTAIAGFMDRYSENGNSVVTILVPQGSANAGAARSTASDFTRFLRAQGVSSGRLQQLSYQANPEDSAPIRISYPVMRASVGQCGRWPEDLLNTYENRNYANFGCAYQNNLAAQIDNPSDLLTPRKMTPTDMGNRGHAIATYQNRGVTGEFIAQSEVMY